MENLEIQPDILWDRDKLESLGDFIKEKSNLQTEERKLQNHMLGIKFQIEDYIESKDARKKMRILDFVKLYLQVLGTSQKELAALFGMKHSNLHKYLVGDRKLNTSLVLKLSAFSNLSPEYWLRIEVKNELIDIAGEEIKNYQKYDFRNLPTVNAKLA